MSWKPEIDELNQRRRWAEELGGAEGVERQHGRGRLTVRERITVLLDDGSFLEIGKLAGEAEYRDGEVQKVTPAPYVMGMGKIDGRPVAVGGEDFTVKGGSSTGFRRRKGGQGGFAEDLAYEYRMPLINLIDGSGGAVSSIRKKGYTVLPGVHSFERCAELLGMVPVVSAVLGTAAGGPAARATLSHWSIMVAGSSEIMVAGPPVVERSLGQKITKEELGGADIAVDLAGTIDNRANSEDEALAAVRRFLSFMPQNVWEMPPARPADDPIERAEEELVSIVPRERMKPYDMRRLVHLVIDDGSAMEIQPTFGRAVITALARLGGYPVGIIASNPQHYGGAMDVPSLRKQSHFIELCDSFHLPIVFFVDVPGFMVGKNAEMAGTLRAGTRCAFAGLTAMVPTISLVIRKCYGMAGYSAANGKGLNFKIGWPSAEWGSLPIEGGVRAAFRREIEAAEDPEAKVQEIEDDLRTAASPFRTAEAFEVEDVIDPRETRNVLCRFIEAAQVGIRSQLGPKPRYGVAP